MVFFSLASLWFRAMVWLSLILLRQTHTHIQTSMHTCINLNTHIHTCTGTSTHTHIHTRAYTHWQGRMHTLITHINVPPPSTTLYRHRITRAMHANRGVTSLRSQFAFSPYGHHGQMGIRLHTSQHSHLYTSTYFCIIFLVSNNIDLDSKIY